MQKGKRATRRTQALVFASLAAVAASRASAATSYVYNGAAGDGNYFTPTNWTPPGPPGNANSDTGTISTSGGPYIVTANGTIGSNGTTSPTIVLTSGNTLQYTSFFGGTGAFENATIGTNVTASNPFTAAGSSFSYQANTTTGTGIEVNSGAILNDASPATDDSLNLYSTTIAAGGIVENTGAGILRLQGAPITNNGILQATGSAVIALQAGSQTSTAGGQFIIGANASAVMTDVAPSYTLTGITTTNNGLFDMNNFNTVVTGARTKTLSVNGGSFTNNGTFNVRQTRPEYDYFGGNSTTVAGIGNVVGGQATTFANTGTLNILNTEQILNPLGFTDIAILNIGSLVNGWTNSGTINISNTSVNPYAYTTITTAYGTNGNNGRLPIAAVLSSYNTINNTGTVTVSGTKSAIDIVNTNVATGTLSSYNQTAGITTLQNGGVLMTPGSDGVYSTNGGAIGNANGNVNINGGSFLIKSGSTLLTPQLNIGSGGTVVVQAGGALGIGSNSGNHDYYQNVNTQISVANGGTFNLNSGSIVNSVFSLNGLTYGGIALSVDGTANIGFNASSPTTTLLSLSSTGTAGQLNLNGNSLTIVGEDSYSQTTPGLSTTFSGTINNLASLTVNGGAQTFGSAVTASGTTTITSGGSLTLTGSGQLSSPALQLGGGTLTATTLAPSFASGTTLTLGSSNISAGTITNTMSLGAITRNVGSSLDFGTLPTTGSITTTTANASPTGGQQTILGGYATVGGGSTWAVSGSGPTAGAISGLSTYSTSYVAAADVDANGSATPGSITINSLRFNNGFSTVNDSGSGDTLNVATGGILQTAASSGAVTFSQGFLTTNSADLVVTQNNSSTPMVINSVIQGSIGLTKAGTGNLTLAGSNTYTGITSVGAGTLEVAGSINSTSVSVSNGATLNVDGNGALSPLTNLTVAGPTYVHSQNTTAVIAGGGRVNLSNNSQTLHTLNGNGLIVVGFSTALTITDGGTFGGFFTDGGGVGNNDTLTIGHADGSTAPPLIFTNNNPNSVATSTYGYGVQSITVQPGATVQLGNGGVSGQLPTINALSFTLNGTLIFDRSDIQQTVVNGFDNGVQETLPLATTGSGNIIQRGTGYTAITASLGGFSGSYSIEAGELSFGNVGNVTGNVADAATLSFTGNSVVSGTISGAGTVLLRSGTVSLTGSNTYTGPTIVGNGKLILGDGSNPVPATGYLSPSTVITVGSFGGSGSTIGMLEPDPASGQTLTLANVINGTGNVVMLGTGTTVLTGADSYGGAAISAGTLQFGNGGTNDTLPNDISQGAAAVGINPGAINFTAAGAAVLDLNSTASPLIVANAITQTNSYSNYAGSLSDIGSGTIILTGANTYVGPTQINSGSTVQVGNLNNTGTLGQATQGYASVVTNNGALTFARTDTGLVVSSAISGTGTLAQIATGTTTLIGTNSYTGSTSANAGSLVEYFDLATASVTGPQTLSNDISPSSNLVLGGGKFTVQGASNGSATALTGATFTTASPVVTGGTGFTTGLAVGQTVSAAGGQFTTYVASIINSTSFTIGGGVPSANGSSVAITVSGTPTYSSSQSFNATTLNPGASSVIATINGGAGTAINLGAITRNSGSAVDFTLPAGTQALNSNGISAVNANTNGILGGWATVSGTSWAVSGGTGTSAGLISSLPNASYSTTFTSGTNVDAGATTVAPGTVAINSLRFNTSGGKFIASTSASGETLTITSGGILETTGVGANAVAINSANLTSGNGSDLIVLQNDTSAAMTINSVINGSIGLTKGGAGSLILNGANTYTGATVIGAGTLQLGTFTNAGSLGTSSAAIVDNGTLAVNEAGSISIPNAIGGFGAVSQIGVGTTTLSAAESYLGATTVTAGTLALTSSVTVNPLSALTLGGGTLSVAARTSSLSFSNTAGVNGTLPGTTTLNAGSSTVSVASLGAGNTLALNGITRNAGGVINFVLPTSGSITTADLNANTILGGYATVGGNTWAVSAASGSTIGAISGLSTFSTTFAAAADVDAPTGASTPGTLAINSLRFNTAGSYTVGANSGDALTVNTGGILETSGVGGNTVAINSATLTSGNDQDLVVIQNNPSASLTVNSVINGLGSLTSASGASVMALTKAGPGTLVLTGANTYGGGNYIVGGTLSISADNNLGAVPAAAGTNITLAGGTLAVTGSTPFSLSANRRIVLNPGGGTIDIAAGQSVTFPAAISGASSLTKADSGTAILSVANSYTGNTTVTGGTLTLSAKTALPVGTNLNIGAGAAVNATNLGTNSANALTVNSLTIASAGSVSTGQLNLANNDLIVRNSAGLSVAASLAQVRNQVAQGFANGTWAGPNGIVSTTAAADTTHLTALGVIQNDNGANTGTALYTTFDTQSVSDSDVLVKYTYYGDANLDGRVDGSDYSRIDAAFLNNSNSPGTPLTGWYNGDFNYDGVINGSDYTLIDNAYNQQSAQILAEVASPVAAPAALVSGGTSAVPEPTTLGLLAIGAAGLLGRRRRRSSTSLAGAH